MSLRCLTWVFHESPAEGFDRLVLLAIADEADDEGGNAFPSQRRLARKAKVGLGSVPAIIRRLEDAGMLRVERPEKPAPGRVNHYQILLPNRSAPEQSAEQFQAENRSEPFATVQNCSEALPKSALTLRPSYPLTQKRDEVEQFDPNAPIEIYWAEDVCELLIGDADHVCGPFCDAKPA